MLIQFRTQICLWRAYLVMHVNTFSSLLKVKSYYLNHENYFADKDELLETNVLFELEEDHHKFYKCYIKGE